jgi:hypothetical protein
MTQIHAGLGQTVILGPHVGITVGLYVGTTIVCLHILVIMHFWKLMVEPSRCRIGIIRRCGCLGQWFRDCALPSTLSCLVSGFHMIGQCSGYSLLSGLDNVAVVVILGHLCHDTLTTCQVVRYTGAAASVLLDELALFTSGGVSDSGIFKIPFHDLKRPRLKSDCRRRWCAGFEVWL